MKLVHLAVQVYNNTFYKFVVVETLVENRCYGLVNRTSSAWHIHKSQAVLT